MHARTQIRMHTHARAHTHTHKPVQLTSRIMYRVTPGSATLETYKCNLYVVNMSVTKKAYQLITFKTHELGISFCLALLPC